MVGLWVGFSVSVAAATATPGTLAVALALALLLATPCVDAATCPAVAGSTWAVYSDSAAQSTQFPVTKADGTEVLKVFAGVSGQEGTDKYVGLGR